uniref:AKAP7 2'5' RNA ligase-like domain n=1 Tax=Schistocephalus solidus TaxID=70667 RepID=A0A0X3PMI5_SCHSO
MDYRLNSLPTIHLSFQLISPLFFPFSFHMLKAQRIKDILKLVISDERIPDNLITVFYTDFATGSETKKPLTEFLYDPVLGLNLSTLGLRDSQITCLKLLDKVIWDKISGVDLISTSSPPPIYALLEKITQDSSLAEVDKLAVGCKAPEHLKRLCAMQAAKPGFRKHRFFVCQRVYDEVVIENAVNMQTKICENIPLLRESCYPPGWFHVTLATFYPAGPEELHLSIRLLQRMVDKHYDESCPHIGFRNAQQFSNFVIVVVAYISDGIHQAICSAFRGEGIELEKQEFVPHLTVIKPPSNIARKLSGRLNVHRYYNRYSSRGNGQSINRLEVCMCGQERDEEGFWLRAASLPVAPNAVF